MILVWYFILTYKELTYQQLWKYCKNLLSQCNCTYTYKYLKEKTKTTQPKLEYYGLWKKKKKPNEQCCKFVAKNVVDVTLFFS